MDKSIISDHLYNDSVSQAVKYVNTIKDEESLFIYAYNYNWDNGFDVPKAIVDNNACSLNIALMLFSAADGTLYLQDKEGSDGTITWLAFIGDLYKRILNNEFQRGKASFDPQLSKVQEYKLKKALSAEELIFITPIEGADYYCNL
jgi:hypothetical protein